MSEVEQERFEGWAHTHTDPSIYQNIKELARYMRQNPTPAEKRLWQRLRGKRVNGFQFRRQHPIGKFIVDFYCPAAKIVVEVDGPIHDTPEHRADDAARQAYLEDLGLRVLRFSNEEVLRQTDAVITEIAGQLAN